MLTFNLHQGSRNIFEEDVEGRKELKAGEECYEVQSSGHGIMIIAVNPQWLWPPSQDLGKLKPAEILGGKKSRRAHPKLISCW